MNFHRIIAYSGTDPCLAKMDQGYVLNVRNSFMSRMREQCAKTPRIDPWFVELGGFLWLSLQPVRKGSQDSLPDVGQATRLPCTVNPVCPRHTRFPVADLTEKRPHSRELWNAWN